MPQELHVLRCFSCEQFQSHIVKKTNKWECKICGAKQSVKKEFGRGSGKDCRLHTQKLNSLRGVKEETATTEKHLMEAIEVDEPSNHSSDCQFSLIKSNTDNSFKPSKWNEFLDSAKTESQLGQSGPEVHQESYCADPKQSYQSSKGTDEKLARSRFMERNGSQVRKQLSSYDEKGLENNVTLLHSSGILNHSQTTKSDSNFKNLDDDNDMTQRITLPSNKRRKPNSAFGNLKLGAKGSSTNRDHTLSSYGNSNKTNLQEPKELSHLETVNESTAARKITLTSSTNMNIKNSHSHSALCLPVFEQSADPSNIDIQLNF